MTRRIAILALVSCLPAAGVVIDRIAIIVDKHAVKDSDIDRDLRVTEFLNAEPLSLSPAARKKSAGRLIDQTVIREEMEKGGYAQTSQSEVDALVKHIVDGRFGGSHPRFQQELMRYGLSEPQLRMELEWQSDVLKFIDDRFRPSVLVSDDQVRAYYDQHKADLNRQFPQLKTYQQVAPKVRASLEGQQLNQNFDQWLAAARKRDRIVYREEGLQ
jgi:hypothetical protein